MDWYKREPDKYEAKTIGLSLAADGAYNRLIDFYYRTEQPIPANDKKIAAIIRVGVDEWLVVKEEVLGFFVLENGKYHQEKCDEVLAEYFRTKAKKSETNRENGKKGGRPKGAKSKEKLHTKPSINPTGTHQKPNIGENRKPNEKPPDGVPSENPPQDAVTKGKSNEKTQNTGFRPQKGENSSFVTHSKQTEIERLNPPKPRERDREKERKKEDNNNSGRSAHRTDTPIPHNPDVESDNATRNKNSQGGIEGIGSIGSEAFDYHAPIRPAPKCANHTRPPMTQQQSDEYACGLLAERVTGGWQTVLAAEDPSHGNHHRSVKLCLAAAKQHGIGWISPELRKAKRT